jgi:hypothetical protein
MNFINNRNLNNNNNYTFDNDDINLENYDNKIKCTTIEGEIGYFNNSINTDGLANINFLNVMNKMAFSSNNSNTTIQLDDDDNLSINEKNISFGNKKVKIGDTIIEDKNKELSINSNYIILDGMLVLKNMDKIIISTEKKILINSSKHIIEFSNSEQIIENIHHTDTELKNGTILYINFIGYNNNKIILYTNGNINIDSEIDITMNCIKQFIFYDKQWCLVR